VRGSEQKAQAVGSMTDMLIAPRATVKGVECWQASIG
jgi:hypothetical protein